MTKKTAVSVSVSVRAFFASICMSISPVLLLAKACPSSRTSLVRKNAVSYTHLDVYKRQFILFVDESHVTLPQVRAMYNGDKARKEMLIKYGFRLPAAADNRPLKFDEFNQRINQAIYLSATPAEYEREKAKGAIVEQIVRPTGLLDPEVIIRDVYKRQGCILFSKIQPFFFGLGDRN